MDIVIVMALENTQYDVDATDQVNLAGHVHAGQDVSTQGPIAFTVNVTRGWDAAAINAAIKAAAVQACVVAEIEVGAVDKKVLLGGAIDL